MKRVFIILFASLAALLPAAAQRLTVGGYGEVALSRNFYSDNVYRYCYKSAEQFYHLSKEDRDAVVKFIDSI